MGQPSIKKNYNTIIIGGGIVGAGLFRDLSLQGVETLLVEKGDFSAQTSTSSSKMLHGGIRYLENLDFHLVYEALHEKNLWLKLAPHLCYEEPFLMPIYKQSKYPLWMYGIGLKLYDFLSQYQNSPHQLLNKNQAISKVTSLNADGLTGAGVYYDAIVDDLKMTLECIYDALIEASSQAENYVSLIAFKKVRDHYECQFRDELTGEHYQSTCKHLVFTTGPFTDKLMKELNFNWKPVLVPSKGSHLWLSPKSFDLPSPVILQTKDNRVVFVIPRNNMILVGTTETQTKEEFYNIKASPEDIDYLKNVVKTFFPEANLDESMILGSYSGVRPLVREHSDQSLSKVSREHKVFMPMKNLFFILGGKYTTFRVMVQGVAERITLNNRLAYNSNKTLSPFRQVSTIPSFGKMQITKEHLLKIIKKEKIRTANDIIDRRISLSAWQNNQGLSQDEVVQFLQDHKLHFTKQ